MTIIDDINIVVPDDLKKARVEQMLRRKLRSLWNTIDSQYRDISKTVWENPQGLTPQEVCDQFGTGAGQMFILSGLIQNVLLTADPSYVVPPRPNELTLNEDGTVTVGAPI